ncbi:LysM domain-containing protein [Actinopolymorpha sp. NPDC004070]|uniref:LysM peptidoglycan-binding domain-containing protein n=1 Tax=Actinopolymorpha sp. NPDC004070 TaxID=3154548 RepID=UPI0033ABAA14
MSNSASVVYLEDFVSRRAGGAPERGRRHLSPVAPPVDPGAGRADGVRRDGVPSRGVHPFLRVPHEGMGGARAEVPAVPHVDPREVAPGQVRPTRRSPADRRRPPRPRGVRSCVLPDDGRDGASTLRLTRRGRLALTTLTAMAALAFVAVLGLLAQAAFDAAAGGAERPTATTTITVEPGETMWGIATQLTPGADPRATVDEIARLNDLSRAGDLRAGQRLIVPVQAR